jgi:hypothetical protein
MSGVRLGSLEASEMLDVLHFMMEEDMLTEYGEAKSDMRVLIWRDIYGVEYPHEYRYKKKSGNGTNLPNAHASAGGDNPYGDLSPVDPQMESKGYIPPTPMSNDPNNPFGDALLPPLG